MFLDSKFCLFIFIQSQYLQELFSTFYVSINNFFGVPMYPTVNLIIMGTELLSMGDWFMQTECFEIDAL